ncbi:hypothetical protein [Microbacterium sp.]|uniref:hypothetical protein n=1 Tax=Microbacterium sp. TaxID=51671 RepID=UPI003F94EFB5
MTKKLLNALTAVLMSGALVLAPVAANAETRSTAYEPSLTVEEAEADLDIIQAHTSGTDGKFDYEELTAAGVADVIATEYAGVLEAAGVPYTAPTWKQAEIEVLAENYEATVEAVAARADVAAADFPWDTVLRVAGSWVECMAIRTSLLAWYPFAVCVPNPDGNGTWLVIYY